MSPPRGQFALMLYVRAKPPQFWMDSRCTDLKRATLPHRPREVASVAALDGGAGGPSSSVARGGGSGGDPGHASTVGVASPLACKVASVSALAGGAGGPSFSLPRVSGGDPGHAAPAGVALPLACGCRAVTAGLLGRTHSV